MFGNQIWANRQVGLVSLFFSSFSVWVEQLGGQGSEKPVIALHTRAHTHTLTHTHTRTHTHTHSHTHTLCKELPLFFVHLNSPVTLNRDFLSQPKPRLIKLVSEAQRSFSMLLCSLVLRGLTLKALCHPYRWGWLMKLCLFWDSRWWNMLLVSAVVDRTDVQ